MLSVIQITHIAVTLCMVLVSTTSAYAWYPYGDRYMQWQKSRPLMYGALHNSVPEDQMPSRVARFKAAGLNTVAWWKPGNAIHMFEAAHRMGLGWACGSIGGRSAIHAAMRVEGNAFVMVGDEPDDLELESISEMTQWVRKVYPNTPVFTNLSFMKVNHDRYVQMCQPDILCFDHYPLEASGKTQEHYLYNIAWGRHSARKYRLPYWLFLQAYGRESNVPSSAYRIPDQADMRFLVFTHLAHGGAGILFFHYYGHSGSMIEDTGVEHEARGPVSGHQYENTVASPAWFAVRDVSSEVKNLSRALVNLRGKGAVGYVGNGVLWDHEPPQYREYNRDDGYRCSRFLGQGALVSMSIREVDNMGALIGFFDDEMGEEYFMIVNLQHALNMSKVAGRRTIRLTFDHSVTGLERLNRFTGEVELIKTTRSRKDENMLDVQLEGGTGDLFKWHNGHPWRLRDAQFN